MSTMKSDSVREGFIPRIETAVIVGLFAAMFAPFMVSLVEAWMSRPDASHGWFVVPIAATLIWKRRKDVLAQPAGSFAPAVGIIIVGLIGAILSARADLESVGRVALVVTLNGLLLYLLGPARYRTIAFPALFLFLMVPVPITITGSLTFPLQIFSSTLSEHAIAALGVPVHRMGNVLQLPAGSLEVAEACSGLRSMMTFVTVGVLLAALAGGVWRRATVVLLSVPFALLANVLRITLTAALVNRFGMGAAEGSLHETVGILSFLVGLGLYAAAARIFGARLAE